jgi:hypothetical protein
MSSADPLCRDQECYQVIHLISRICPKKTICDFTGISHIGAEESDVSRLLAVVVTLRAKVFFGIKIDGKTCFKLRGWR